MSLSTEETNYQRAEKLIEINRFREAVPLLTKAYSQNPQNYQVICSLSFCFLKLNENDKSLNYAEKAIAIDPENEWAYELKTITFFRRGNFKDALRYSEKATLLNPESESSLVNLVYAYLHNERTEDARKAADKLLKYYPDSAQSHYAYGLVEKTVFNYAEAENCFRQALEIDPLYAEVRNNLAIVVKEIARKEENNEKKEVLEQMAFEHFTESVKLDPNNPQVLENIKIQFEISGYIFGLIYFLPFLMTGLIIHPQIALVFSFLVFIVFGIIIQNIMTQKKQLSPEIRALLKIRDHKLFAKETSKQFFQRGKVFYQTNWKHVLAAVTIFIISLLIKDLDINFWLYFAPIAFYWINFIWLFSGMFRYAGPK